MLQTWLPNVTREVAISLSHDRILIDNKLFFTRPAFHSSAPQFLINGELSLTGGALNAETHQTSIYRGR